MAHFKIEIEGQHDGIIGWSTSFYDDDRLGDADVSYINDIARELEVAVNKLHQHKEELVGQRPLTIEDLRPSLRKTNERA